MKKICSILIVIMLLLNSSLLIVVSNAVEAVDNIIKQTTEVTEKMSMDLSYTQLTNKVQNELIITGILERDTEQCKLYSNPIVYFEFPPEVEKVVINSANIMYDDELTLKDYKVETNEDGKQVIKITIDGTQTKYQKDTITKGTNIRISTNVILKQEMKTTDGIIKMTCENRGESGGKVTTEKLIKLINSKEIENPSQEIEEPGKIVNANGLKIETKAILGDSLLKENEEIYSNEIIKYEISVTNTTKEPINNIKLLGHIPEGMIYVDYSEEAFSYWAETYTPLETNQKDQNGVYWQDDTYQYPEDETVKTKEIQIDTINSKETKTYYYEVKVKKLEEAEKEISTQIDLELNNELTTIYKSTNVAKNAEFELRIRQYASGMVRDEYTYHFIAKNLTTENKSAEITIKIPATLKIEEIIAYELGETVDYKIDAGILKINCGEIKANYFKAFVIKTKIINVNDIAEENNNYTYKIKFGASIKSANEKGLTYKSNQNETEIGIEAVEITQSSETNGEKIKELKEITYEYKIKNIGNPAKEWGEYTAVVFEDNIPNELAITSVEYNNFIVEEIQKFSRTYKTTPVDCKFSSVEVAEANGRDGTKTARVKINLNIKAGETITIRIKTRTRTLTKEQDGILIENYATVSGERIKTKKSNIVQNTLYKPDTTNNIVIDSNGNVVEDPTNPNNPDDPNQPSTGKTKFDISGLAWIDENSNGRRDNGEQLKPGIKVSLLDVEKNSFVKDNSGNIITKTTDEKGEYSFTRIQKGKYYVVFEYDSEEYSITEYQKTGVSGITNCDAVKKQAVVLGKEKTIGLTNTINLESDRTNIDIGFIQNKKFDLKIEQFIQKITVVNSKGTKEYNYNNKKFAKVEIHSKQFSGSTIAIEYKIIVTNIGEIAGTVNEIIDEIPSQLEFHSELNSDWTKSMTDNASNTSFGTQEIKPGESIETTIILSKTLKEDSAGTLTNISKIGISDNTKHIEDSNKENDTATTEVIVGIETGAKTIIKVIGGIMLILVIALIIFAIMKKFSKKKGLMAIIFALIFGLTTFTNKEVKGYSVEGTIADMQAAVNQAIANDYAEAIAATKENPNVSVKLVGYNPNYEGSGIFIVMQGDKLVGTATCGAKGDYFHTHYDEVPIYKTDEDGNVTDEVDHWEEIAIGTFYASSSHAIACHYGGSTEPVINNITITVTGDDFPEGGQLVWEGQGVEAGQDFYMGSEIPDSFSAAESTAIWNGVSSAIDRTNLSSYDLGSIQTSIESQGISVGSCTADLIQGTSGVTSLSVTVSRSITFHVSYSISWEDIYYVDEDYVCSCGKVLGSKRNQIIPVATGDSGSFEHREEYSTTVTFEPEDLPKSLTIFKYDEETGEKLYTLPNCESEFRFLVKGDGGEWEVGVGESLNGLHAGTYEIYEISSSYGYGVWEDNYNTSAGYKKIYDYTINEGDIICICNIGNKKEFVDLSGYVWEDMLSGKDNLRDNIYTKDIDKRVQGVKVTIYDPVRGTSYSTFTDENGQYHFGSRNGDLTYTGDTLRVKDLNKYYIEFEYNGIKYGNVELKPLIENGAKATEGTKRLKFNDKFSEITSDGTTKDTNGNTTGGYARDPSGNTTATGISYNQNEEYTSTITYTEGKPINDYYGLDKYHVTSATMQDSYRYKLEDLYTSGNEAWRNNEITNINLGLYEREQVDISLSSDIEDVIATLKGYTHTYHYASRNKYIENNGAFDVGVKFGNKYTNKYTRTVYESAVSWSKENFEKDNSNMLKVYVVYKVTLKNQSTTLKAKVNEIVNYFDSQYTVDSIFYKDGENIVTTDEYKVTENVGGSGDKNFNKVVIKNPLGIIENQTTQEIFIKFLISDNSVLGLTRGDSTLDDMSEITSYSTYYGDNTTRTLFEAIDQYNVTKTNVEQIGGTYASIDRDSAPGNAKIELTTTEDNANRLVKTTYEDDTDMAPSFVLQMNKKNVIKGTVFEDSRDEEKSGANEILGNGKYADNENVIHNAKVELIDLDKNEVATIYQIENYEQKLIKAETYTDEHGNYEFVGIVPGRYILRYTYGNTNGMKTEIIKPDGTVVKEVDARDYKSTIITSDVIKNALNVGNDGYPQRNGDINWYVNDEYADINGTPYTVKTYSNAVDDMKKRAEYENLALTNSTIDDKYNISADTANFEVSVEFENVTDLKTQTDEYSKDEKGNPIVDENGLPTMNPNLVSTIDKLDFGIVGRATIDYSIDKTISHITIILANGQVLLDGDPSKPGTQLPYVRTGLDDLVPIEMDAELIQGATLKITYDVNVRNSSQIDYDYRDEHVGATLAANGRKYYILGDATGAVEGTTVEIVGDYLDPELAIDTSELANRFGGELSTAEYLKENGYIKEQVYNKLKEKEYTVITTENYKDVGANTNTVLSYETTKLLSSKDDMSYSNDVEILQLSGRMKRSYISKTIGTPGNLIPEKAKERDEDTVHTIITPPTGVIISKIIYISTLAIGLAVIALSVIFIKKRILGK